MIELQEVVNFLNDYSDREYVVVIGSEHEDTVVELTGKHIHSNEFVAILVLEAIRTRWRDIQEDNKKVTPLIDWAYEIL